ncbi:unnamed protein product [Lampetra planeri]
MCSRSLGSRRAVLAAHERLLHLGAHKALAMLQLDASELTASRTPPPPNPDGEGATGQPASSTQGQPASTSGRPSPAPYDGPATRTRAKLHRFS